MINPYDDPVDIAITLNNADGAQLTLVVPWEDDIYSWQDHFKTILTHLQFEVDEVEINPESDDPQGGEDD